MKKYLNQIGKWLAAVIVAVTVIQANALAANAEIVYPGETFAGPLVPQFVIHAVDCQYPEFAEYSFYIVSDQETPLSDRNVLPCGNPSAIDSYFPPGNVFGDGVVIENIGEVPIVVEPVFR